MGDWLVLPPVPSPVEALPAAGLTVTPEDPVVVDACPGRARLM